jgi:hypothetical protein
VNALSIFKFKEDDIFRNTIRTHPYISFYVYDGVVHHNQIFPSSSLGGYSFIRKEGMRESFKTITTSDFNDNFGFGDELTGSSQLHFSSSLERTQYTSTTRTKINALKNTLDYYNYISIHHAYSSSYGNKATQTINLVEIPSIFYGSRIKQKSMEMKFYVTGTLVGHLHDQQGNGELVQIGPAGSTGSGSVAGVVLYREGFVALTGSWALTEEGFDFEDNGGTPIGNWTYWGAGISSSFGSGIIPNISFDMTFSGTQRVQNITMMCHALENELNYSNNPTYIKFGQMHTASLNYATKTQYKEDAQLLIKNTTNIGYDDPTGSFAKTTYISKVKIYDEDMNVIGIAKLAKPLKKTENRSYTVKIGIDI